MSVGDDILGRLSQHINTARAYSTPSSPVEDGKDPMASFYTSACLQEKWLCPGESASNRRRGSLPSASGSRRLSQPFPEKTEVVRGKKDERGLRDRKCSLNQLCTKSLAEKRSSINSRWRSKEQDARNTTNSHDLRFSDQLQLSKAPLVSSRAAIARLRIAIRAEEQQAPDARLTLQRSDAKGKNLYDDAETSLVSELDVMFANSSSLMRTNTQCMLLAQVSIELEVGASPRPFSRPSPLP